jgi:hypothetical protein
MKQTQHRTRVKNRKYTRKHKGGSGKSDGLMGDLRDELSHTYASLTNRAKIAASKSLGDLWTFSKLTTEKKNLKPIEPDRMKENKKYYIEYKGCSFESGIFEEIFSEGIHTGAVFKSVKLLYKSSKRACMDFPSSYTKPIYGEDNDTVIGRSGEIRLNGQYTFYEDKP